MWGDGDWWAPDVIQHGRTYYMYYVGKSFNGSHCVAVATSKSPTGPFTPPRVIGCADEAGQGYIDPAPFIDADGKAYLYVSVDNPYHNISVIPLASDLLHAAGPRKELFTLSQAWENGPNFATVEGPFMLKHGHPTICSTRATIGTELRHGLCHLRRRSGRSGSTAVTLFCRALRPC